jgi:hypothetical protein
LLSRLCLLERFLKQINAEPIRLDHDLLYASPDEIAIAIFLKLCMKAFPQGLKDRPLDLGCRDTGDRAGVFFATLQQSLRDIIRIPNPLLVGMARTHRIAAIVLEEAGQNG